MPGYRIRMGFGLHIGWGIEGAIGSKFKIDASYLSPNVNMAARLEAATKQFGVTLLISGGVYRFCSDAYKKVLRHLDRVTVKGSIQPIDFYTIDTDAESLPLDSKEKENMTGIEKRKMGVKRKSDRDTRRERIFSQKLTTSRLLDTDTDYQEMRKPFKQVPFFKNLKIRHFMSDGKTPYNCILKDSGKWPSQSQKRLWYFFYYKRYRI